MSHSFTLFFPDLHYLVFYQKGRIGSSNTDFFGHFELEVALILKSLLKSLNDYIKTESESEWKTIWFPDWTHEFKIEFYW